MRHAPLIALCLFAAPALAQQAPQGSEQFIAQAAADTIADVEAARLIQSATGIPDSVRELGRQISADAMRTNDRLVQLAQPRNVPLANQISPNDRLALDHLGALSGPVLARAYLGYVLADLERDQTLYAAATTLPDEPVAQFARETLPHLNNRLMVTRAVHDAQVAEGD